MLDAAPTGAVRIRADRLGALLVVVGLLVVLRVRLPWLGRLPGFSRHPADIRIERDGTRIYIPIVTCLVISLVLTAPATLVALLLRRR